MTNEDFLDKLQIALTMFKKAISTDENQWIVKGFIDIYKNIYTISLDTKIISKVLELLLFPLLKKFVVDNGIELKLCPQQNFYPDITFIDKTTNKLFVVDIKTTYRIDDKNVNGMTLGSFTGYFRNRNSNKNIVFPYYQYSGHFILGIIYSQSIDVIDEQKKYTLDDLQKIPSVIHDFHFFAQPKYKIATYHPGSGNTKNIGAITKIEDLINGSGPFSELGEDIFDDYWMYYLTVDMAKALEIKRPYTNLKQYHEYKSKGLEILKKNKNKIMQMQDDSKDLNKEDK